MYDIKLGQGCGIKATMLTPAGGVCDLRRARYIAASLVLVSGATMISPSSAAMRWAPAFCMKFSSVQVNPDNQYTTGNLPPCSACGGR